MRITLEDKNDREKIMKNAKNLAEAEPMFKNISICNDYNKEEREKIRSSVEAARELSKNDPHLTYKVVGPPPGNSGQGKSRNKQNAFEKEKRHYFK